MKTCILTLSKGLVTVIILILIISTQSCNNSDEPIIKQKDTDGFTIIDHQVYDMSDVMDNIMATEDVADAYDYHDLYYDMTSNAPGDLFYLIAHDKVTYTSIDDDGNPIELSGLFIYPYRLSGEKIDVPLISVNHGTELLKKYAPSNWKSAEWHPKKWGNFAEVIIADLMAISYGWAIVMPDYQGMGDDLGESHPYCIREKLATAVADMVETGINTIKDNRHEYVNWDGELYVYGYSEGGFVTMAATRELEERNVSLNGSVCMEGPYDLSGAMREVMLNGEPFPKPYFLPLMLVGYHDVYSEAFDYNITLKEEYRTNIPKYTNGFYDEAVVDSIMPQSTILKDIFTDAFIDTLNNPNTQAYKLLSENNSYNWQLSTPTLLWHCKNDDCVTFENFVTAKDYFTSHGISDIDYVEFPPFPNWAGTVHVSVAPIAFKEGASWIHNKRKSN